MRTIRQHPLITFYVLAFGLTWMVWLPRALGVDFGLVGRLWTWMPAVAALLAAALTGGRAAVREWAARLVRWRVCWYWYAVVIVAPCAFSVAVAACFGLIGGSWRAALPWTAVPPAMLALFLIILLLSDGLGEEPAWRGFALPRLLERHRALVASLIVGVLWALWHLPLLWTESMKAQQLPWWLLLLDVPAKAIIFTWVFLRTSGSVLIAAILHASTNLFTVSPAVATAGDLTLPVLATAAKWLLILIVASASWLAAYSTSRRPDKTSAGVEERNGLGQRELS
jgi:membrane protease YdiL (CAAX protease family)